MPVSNSERCASKRAVHPEPETVHVTEGTGASKRGRSDDALSGN